MGPLREARTPKPPRDEPAPAADRPDTPALPGPIDIRSLALTTLAVIAGIVLLRYAQAVIIPVVLGVLISYALEPLVAAVERARIVRPLAAALVLLTVVGAGGTLLYQLRYQAAEIVEQLPEAARRLRRIVEGERGHGPTAIEQVQKAATELERAANAAAPPPGGNNRVQVQEPPFRVTQYLVWGSMNLFAGAMQVLMILFLSYFLLASGDLYRRKLVKIAGPSLAKKKITLQILREIDRPDRALPRRAAVHQRDRRRRDLAGVSVDRARAGRRSGDFWPACSTRSRTSARSSSPAPSASSRSSSSAKSVRWSPRGRRDVRDHDARRHSADAAGSPAAPRG